MKMEIERKNQEKMFDKMNKFPHMFKVKGHILQ